jgi:hypothetical protein
MHLFWYLFVFITDGTLGLLLGFIFASGAARERSIELDRMHNIAKTSIDQGLGVGTDG